MAFEVEIKQVRKYKKEVSDNTSPVYTFKEGITLNYNITNFRAICSELERCGGIIYHSPDVNNIVKV